MLYPIFGMIAFSAAFAIPFFLLALFPQYLAKMPKSGGWLSVVKAFMGFLELVAAVKFLSSADLAFNLGLFTRGVFLSMWATILFIAGFYMLGWLIFPHQSETKIGWVRRGFGVGTFRVGYDLTPQSCRRCAQQPNHTTHRVLKGRANIATAIPHYRGLRKILG